MLKFSERTDSWSRMMLSPSKTAEIHAKRKELGFAFCRDTGETEWKHRMRDPVAWLHPLHVLRDEGEEIENFTGRKILGEHIGINRGPQHLPVFPDISPKTFNLIDGTTGRGIFSFVESPPELHSAGERFLVG